MQATVTRRVFGLTSLAMLVMCALIVYLVFVSSIDFFIQPKHSLPLTTGDRAIGVYENISDLDSAVWQPIALPDNWQHQNIETTQSWYRFQFTKPNIESNHASLYIPTVRQNLEIYLNGNWLGQGGPFEPHLAHLWSHPQLFQFPTSALVPNNTLHIKLVTNRDNVGYLSKVYLGDDPSIQTAWQWRKLVKVTFVEISSVLLIIVGLINLYLWQLRREDSYYFWYALAALCWGLRGYILIEPVLPISNELRVALRLITLGYGVVFVLLFNLRYFGYKHRYVDWALLLYLVPAALPMLFMEMEQLRIYGHLIWVKGNLILGLVTAAFLLTLYFRNNKKDAILLLFGGMPLLLLGFRDMLVLNDRWPPENAFLMNHATLPALTIAMWFILRRLSNSLKYSEELNITLESRVRLKELEIAKSYKQQQELKQQQIVSDERERIMRDMHDGLGGYLVGLKSLMDAKAPSLVDIKNYVDLALVDLRLVINSLDATSQNLSSLLGSMRGRWQLLAESKNRKLIWKVSRTKVEHQFGPSTTLEIMRILEEAFTNSIKHSHQSDIEIICGDLNEDNYLYVEVINKCQPNFTATQIGRGLTNMTLRAEKIGAVLTTRKLNDYFYLTIKIPVSN